MSRPPIEYDKDRAPDSISDTDVWLNRNCDLDNPNHIQENCAGDDESDIEHNNAIEYPEWLEQPGETAASNEPRLVQPTRKEKRQAQQLLLTVNAVEMLRNKGGKNK
jgi:hypothetical protein